MKPTNTEISASILVPYRPDGGHRDRAWSWIRNRWGLLFSEYPIYIGSSIGANGFQRAAACNQAASQSNTDVYIFADCDTTTDSEWVREAVQQVGNEEIPWALYRHCHKLDKWSTSRVLESNPGEPLPSYEIEETTSGVSWGGVIIVPRRGFEEVGGFDERFTVWGAHDVCFAVAMDTIWGRHVRFDSTIYHLWHPTLTIQQSFGHPAQYKQQLLTERYTKAAWTTEEAMREVRFG